MRLHDVGKTQRQAQRCLERFAARKRRRISSAPREAVDDVQPQARLRIARGLRPAHQLELARRQHAQALVCRRDHLIEVHALNVRLEADFCAPGQVAVRCIGHQLDSAVALLDVACALQRFAQMLEALPVRGNAQVHGAKAFAGQFALLLVVATLLGRCSGVAGGQLGKLLVLRRQQFALGG